MCRSDTRWLACSKQYLQSMSHYNINASHDTVWASHHGVEPIFGGLFEILSAMPHAILYARTLVRTLLSAMKHRNVTHLSRALPSDSLGDCQSHGPAGHRLVGELTGTGQLAAALAGAIPCWLPLNPHTAGLTAGTR